jgi:transposase
MEDKELNAFRDSKPHHQEEWLRNAFVVEGKEVGEIAKELHISYKLVHILLEKYGIKYD